MSIFPEWDSKTYRIWERSKHFLFRLYHINNSTHATDALLSGTLDYNDLRRLLPMSSKTFHLTFTILLKAPPTRAISSGNLFVISNRLETKWVHNSPAWRITSLTTGAVAISDNEAKGIKNNQLGNIDGLISLLKPILGATRRREKTPSVAE